MASCITNRGKKRMLDGYWRGLNRPTKHRAVRITDAAVPTADTNTMSELTEVAAGNGYTSGGIDIELSAVGWDTLTEDDASDLAKVLAKDLSWTASGGTIPSTRGIAIIDDNATLANAEVLAFVDFVANQVIGDGIIQAVEDAEIRLT